MDGCLLLMNRAYTVAIQMTKLRGRLLPQSPGGGALTMIRGRVDFDGLPRWDAAFVPRSIGSSASSSTKTFGLRSKGLLAR